MSTFFKPRARFFRMNHKLTVKWHDAEFKTRNFVVRRGETEELRVEYEPSRDRTHPGHRPPPAPRGDPYCVWPSTRWIARADPTRPKTSVIKKETYVQFT